ncbi:hypothetical protein ACLKA6_015602 [Drosophila palustris]
MNAFAEWDIDLKLVEQQPAGQEEQLVQIKDKNNVVSKTTEPPINFTDKKITTTRAKRTSRIQEAGNRKQPLCNPKSYAIARSARKREQQQRLSIMKRRIIRSLQNDEVKSIRKPFREQQINDLQKLLPNNQHKITKLKPLVTIDEAAQKIMILQKENSSKGNLQSFKIDVNLPSNKLDLYLPKSKMVEKPNQISEYNTISSPIIIKKIEYLPKLTLNLDKSQSIKLSSLEHTLKRNNEAVQMEKPANEMLKQPRRRSSISGISSPAMVAKKRARRPSYSDPNCRQTQMQSVKPELKRKQLTMNISEAVKEKRTKPEDSPQLFPSFDLSESVVEFLQTDLKSSQLDADSLLQLAEPKIERNSDPIESVINQVERERVILDEKLKMMTEDAHKIEANSTVRAKVRDDLTLLQLVGLPIIKDPNIEDRQPVEYSEELRSKASKFGQMLKEHNTVWNPQRYNGQFNYKIRKELPQLTKEVNDKLKANINVSELKRILNLLHAWHVQKIHQKYFKKVTLSTTIEYYLLLFGFLPRTKCCLYYCEWCEECNFTKSRYEKHRMIHQSPVNPALIMKPFNLMEGSQATFTYSCMPCRAHSHWDHQPQLICIHYRRVYVGHGANVWAPEGNQPLD